MNRRQFALGTGTHPVLVLSSSSTSRREIIMHNANIFWSIAHRLKFQAITIVNEKIVAAGGVLIENFLWGKIEINDRNISL